MTAKGWIVDDEFVARVSHLLQWVRKVQQSKNPQDLALAVRGAGPAADQVERMIRVLDRPPDDAPIDQTDECCGCHERYHVMHLRIVPKGLMCEACFLKGTAET